MPLQSGFDSAGGSAAEPAGRIVVLGTGGTIAGTADDPADSVAYRSGQLGVEQLLVRLPAGARCAGAAIECEQLAQIDSKDMDDATWRALAVRCAQLLARADVQAIVVTHGTDTLEETAWFLQRVLEPARPVVLASAMRPATALLADGPQNLLDALAVARTAGARGVLAVAAGRVHGARDVRKHHPFRLDAIGSGDAGPLAEVEEGRVRLLHAWPAPAQGAERLLAAVRGWTGPWPRVAIVTSHAGADGAVVDALRSAGVDGIVVAGSGNGTVHHRLEAALRTAREAGVRVVRSTRCAEGQVVVQAGGTAGSDAFAVSSAPPLKARIDLQLDLMAERIGAAPATSAATAAAAGPA